MILAVKVITRRRPLRAEVMADALLSGSRSAKKVRSAESSVEKGGLLNAFRRRAKLRAQPKVMIIEMVEVSSMRMTIVDGMRSQ